MKNLRNKSGLCTATVCMMLLLFNRAGAQAVIVAQNDLFNVLQGSCSYYLDIKANDFTDTFTVVQIQNLTQPGNGTAAVSTNGNYVTYCPLPGFTGTDNFSYSIMAGNTTSTANVYINVLPFNSFVFAGDADQNGKVENFDVLTLGLAYNLSGPSRVDSSSIAALSWPPSPYINTNPGAADCNGDGLVDTSDLQQVEQFYGDTFTGVRRYDVDTSICNNGIPFYIEALSGDSVSNGDTLDIAIKLGNDLTVNAAYGIAFTLSFDTGFIPGNSIQFSTSSSWLLQNDAGLFFHRSFQNTGQVQLALTKTDHTGAHGGGTLLLARIPIDDNIDGSIHAPGWYNLYLGLGNTRLVSEYNVVQNICTTQPTLKVYKNAASISKEEANPVNVYPNPANDKIFIRAEKIQQIEITDITGRKIYSAAFGTVNMAMIDIKSTGIEAGAYLVHVKTENSTGVKKIIVQQ